MVNIYLTLVALISSHLILFYLLISGKLTVSFMEFYFTGNKDIILIYIGSILFSVILTIITKKFKKITISFLLKKSFYIIFLVSLNFITLQAKTLLIKYLIFFFIKIKHFKYLFFMPTKVFCFYVDLGCSLLILSFFLYELLSLFNLTDNQLLVVTYLLIILSSFTYLFFISHSYLF